MKLVEGPSPTLMPFMRAANALARRSDAPHPITTPRGVFLFSGLFLRAQQGHVAEGSGPAHMLAFAKLSF